MYDRRLKDEFWTSFGKYMSLSPSATGEKQSWLNYRTGVKYLQFRMSADEHHAVTSIEISNPDPELRNRFYKQFSADQDLMNQYIHDAWNWEESITENGREISRISQQIQHVNIYLKSDWPAIISFLKAGITSLNFFWAEQKDLYEMIAG